MYDDQQEIATITRLILKDIQGKLSREEQRQLQEWVKRSPQNKRLHDRCLDGATQEKALGLLSRFDSHSAWKKFSKRIQPNTNEPAWSHSLLKYWPYAAAILLVAMVGIFTYAPHNDSPRTDIANVQKVDYEPAGNHANISLSDGRSYNLDERSQQIVSKGNSLTYQDGKTIIDAGKAQYATVNTPRGGVYQITLPDGTRVHMNASSSVTYPLAFTGKTRVVELIGEAYFDVARETNRPFIVKSQGQTIEVLGTRFNVHDYSDEQTSTTTLVSGRVRIDPKPGKVDVSNVSNSMMLLPGEQGRVKQGRITKQKVDVDRGIAWMKGRFDFDGKHLREVMQEISRWYDVDVVYEGIVPDIEFYGGAFRNSKLSTILSILENNDITYQMREDKKIIIKPLLDGKRKEVEHHE